MKSAPQMLQLLREIDDPVSFAAGSSCSESQELWLDWCQCQSGFHSPSSPSETNPLGLLLGCPRTTSLQKGPGPAACGALWNLCSQIPSHSHDLEIKALLPWGDVLGATDPEPQEIPSSALTPPSHESFPSPSPLVAVPQTQVYFLTSWAMGFPSDSLAPAENIFDEVQRVPSDVVTASWLWCCSWFMWGRVRQTRTWKCFSRTS